ncbi:MULTISPECIES: hypothetical protein [unclassified Bradyrhizobium]|uniref:hypothetical protein n=1 Tax=unclassified Bradyrhizobium TaxID=2631580 RepID=UPI0033940414
MIGGDVKALPGGVAAVDVDAAAGPTGIITREELQRESDRAAGIVREAGLRPDGALGARRRTWSKLKQVFCRLADH